MTKALDFASQLGVTPPDNDADTSLATTAFVASLQRGFIDGLTLSRTTITTFTVAPGIATNEDVSTRRVMVLGGSGITKSLSPWAQGNNNGGLDVATVLSSTWYHVHLIHRASDNAVDVLYSLSATNPTMPTGWVARRRLGSFLTNGSSQITPFFQQNDVFYWDVPVGDVNATNPGAAAVTRTLTVPTGVVVFPIVAWHINNGTSPSIAFLATALNQADTTPSNSAYQFITSNPGNGNGGCVVQNVPTNTSAQVRSRLSASGASDILRASTLGWVDPRGKG